MQNELVLVVDDATGDIVKYRFVAYVGRNVDYVAESVQLHVLKKHVKGLGYAWNNLKTSTVHCDSHSSAYFF